MIQSLKDVFKIASGAAMVYPTAALASTGAAASLALGPVGFAAPWVLLGLGTLPALWWLMKSVPPKPVMHDFPAMSILFNMNSEDQSPARMPLWQRLLRLSAAGLVITGLAQPHFQNDVDLAGQGPVMLVVDNGWSSARNWTARTGEMKKILVQVERENRQIVLLQTAAPANGGAMTPSAPMTPEAARKILLEMQPQPWPVNRQGALDAVRSLALDQASSVIWISNGLNDEGAMALAEHLQKFGKLTVMQDEPAMGARLLVPPIRQGEDLSVTIRRAVGDKGDRLTLIASDETGRAVAEVEAVFNAGETETVAVFSLPREMRSQLARIHIDGENSAGAVVLLDERWRRRPVGLVESSRVDTGRKVLTEEDYVSRALEPYVDLQQGNVDSLLQNKLAVMILTDSVMINDAALARVAQWVEQGGTLLRFAGPNLAARQKDDGLVPVPLIPGAQQSRSQVPLADPSATLSPFAETSPFKGIEIPADIRVNGKVAARPGVDLEEQTWAKLEDGTPLVTARRSGEGWIVLIHTTANTEWSNLALSSAFADMMRAVVSHSHGVDHDPNGPDYTLPALKTLDGNGQLVSPQAGLDPLTKSVVAEGRVGPRNPPGLYGNESIRQAHNLSTAVKQLEPLPEFGQGVERMDYRDGEKADDLSGPLLAGAMSLLIVDLLVLLSQQGMLPRRRRDNKPSPAPKAG